MERHFYGNLANAAWYKLVRKSPKAQTKTDVNMLYHELDHTKEMLENGESISVKRAEIFMINVGEDDKFGKIVAFFIPEDIKNADDFVKKSHK